MAKTANHNSSSKYLYHKRMFTCSLHVWGGLSIVAAAALHKDVYDGMAKSVCLDISSISKRHWAHVSSWKNEDQSLVGARFIRERMYVHYETSKPLNSLFPQTYHVAWLKVSSYMGTGRPFIWIYDGNNMYRPEFRRRITVSAGADTEKRNGCACLSPFCAISCPCCLHGSLQVLV